MTTTFFSLTEHNTETPADPREWRHGVVAWFNAEKGFGFIHPDDKTCAVFVEYSSIDATGYRTLSGGDPVVFTTTGTTRGPEAARVRPYRRDTTHQQADDQPVERTHSDGTAAHTPLHPDDPAHRPDRPRRARRPAESTADTPRAGWHRDRPPATATASIHRSTLDAVHRSASAAARQRR